MYVQSGDTYTPPLEPVAHAPRTVTDPLLGTVYVHPEFALHHFPVASIMYCPLYPDRRMVMVSPAVSEPPQATEPSLAEPAEDCCTVCPIMVLPAVMERDGLSIPGVASTIWAVASTANTSVGMRHAIMDLWPHLSLQCIREPKETMYSRT